LEGNRDETSGPRQRGKPDWNFRTSSDERRGVSRKSFSRASGVYAGNATIRFAPAAKASIESQM
jgi:hypothetical protein